MNVKLDELPEAVDIQESRSSLLQALSEALDIAGGQPEGHSARTFLIARRIADSVYLTPDQQEGLFYGGILKDLGCSSNASRMTALFASDDRTAKDDLKSSNWTSLSGSLSYLLRNVAPDQPVWQRIKALFSLATDGRSVARELAQIRAAQGRRWAEELGVGEESCEAIENLDEHWNGQGQPHGRVAEQIPLLARVVGIAQTMEVMVRKFGLRAAYSIVNSRDGRWFDPELVARLNEFRADVDFWCRLYRQTPAEQIARIETPVRVSAGEDFLDRVADVFSKVVDAKSPWTLGHSQGVAEVATGMARMVGFSPARCRWLRRAALLHDLGKLRVSNLILDKRGPLTAEEMAEVREHPRLTLELLGRTNAFRSIALLAAAHHERLDGQGYCFGLSGDELGPAARILAVADMFEALASRRPYRQDLADEEVLAVLERQAGSAICPEALAALHAYLATHHFVPVKLAA